MENCVDGYFFPSFVNLIHESCMFLTWIKRPLMPDSLSICRRLFVHFWAAVLGLARPQGFLRWGGRSVFWSSELLSLVCLSRAAGQAVIIQTGLWTGCCVVRIWVWLHPTHFRDTHSWLATTQTNKLMPKTHVPNLTSRDLWAGWTHTCMRTRSAVCCLLLNTTN